MAGRTLIALALVGLAAMQPAVRPLIIAHRGASGHRPEHTLEAYRLAIEMGADVIEPDLVRTKDGVLVARHENEIGATTDVAVKFASRRTTKQIDGKPVNGWFVEDFSLAELRTLRARERLASRSDQYDGQYAIPTFDEVLDLAASAGRARGRDVGVYPETKHPAYFRSIGLPLEELLVQMLGTRGLSASTSPVFIQSFEAASLQRLRRLTTVRLVQLLDEGADVTPARLKAISAYANGVGLNKRLVVPAAANGTLLTATTAVRDAHAAGLFVHVWTMRSDAPFLASAYGGDPRAEVRQFIDLGVDGLFTDFPDVGVSVVSR